MHGAEGGESQCGRQSLKGSHIRRPADGRTEEIAVARGGGRAERVECGGLQGGETSPCTGMSVDTVPGLYTPGSEPQGT